MTRFSGFESASAQLFSELAANNNREFFESHKADYTRLVKEPMEQLLEEAEPVYGHGHITRPNRDLRFSADKSPYRIDAHLWAGRVGCVVLTLAADGIRIGGGLEPTRDQLDRARSTIDSKPENADELRGLLDELTSTGFELTDSAVKTTPRGFAADNPAIDLLRRKNYAATTHLNIDARAADIWHAWKQVEPLLEWATDKVGASQTANR